MKCSCTACCLEAIAAHYFQGMFAQCRAVGREQNMAVSLCQSENVNQQVFEIMFDLKRLSSGRTRKVGGSRMITSNFSPFRTSRGKTDLTSSAIKRCSTVGRQLKAKFSRPRAR